VYCIGLAQLQDVKWLQSITSMPILVKGVVTAEDGKLIFFILLVSFVLTLNEDEYVIQTDAGEPAKPQRGWRSTPARRASSCPTTARVSWTTCQPPSAPSRR
jgi:hypothetical protein